MSTEKYKCARCGAGYSDKVQYCFSCCSIVITPIVIKPFELSRDDNTYTDEGETDE